MTYEIRESANGKFSLFVNGGHIADYTRKSTAKRGLERFLAARNIQPDLLTEAVPVSEAGEARADAQTDSRTAAAGCAAAQTPPASNTGGTIDTGKQGIVSRRESHFITVNGKLKEIPLRAGYGTFAHIDTLTFTVKSHVFFADGQDGDDIMLANIDAWLREIFGYGLYIRKRGMHGYAESYLMGYGDKVKYGAVMWGGKAQEDTVCVHIYGTGCTAATDGWETRLYDWINQYAPYTKITRVDLAKDLFKGELTVWQVYDLWQQGELDYNGKRPDFNPDGGGWFNAPEKGKTAYFGSRKNSSWLLYAYEKGIEQGDPLSPWVRLEARMRARDIIIPHEVLIEPGTYFLGRYPVFQKLLEESQPVAKCEYIQVVQEANIRHIMHYLSVQAAPAAKFLLDLGFDDSQLVQAILRENADYPKRLHPAAFDVRFAETAFIKEYKRRPCGNEVESYAFELLESKRHQQRPNPQERRDYEENIKRKQYLKCIFGSEPYNYDIHGCDYEIYLHRRYGSVRPRCN